MHTYITYIHTYITYMHTYITYIRTYIHTWHTCIHTVQTWHAYIHTYITYVHTYIHYIHILHCITLHYITYNYIHIYIRNIHTSHTWYTSHTHICRHAYIHHTHAYIIFIALRHIPWHYIYITPNHDASHTNMYITSDNVTPRSITLHHRHALQTLYALPTCIT